MSTCKEKGNSGGILVLSSITAGKGGMEDGFQRENRKND
jgi:hypothetical protein